MNSGIYSGQREEMIKDNVTRNDGKWKGICKKGKHEDGKNDNDGN